MIGFLGSSRTVRGCSSAVADDCAHVVALPTNADPLSLRNVLRFSCVVSSCMVYARSSKLAQLGISEIKMLMTPGTRDENTKKELIALVPKHSLPVKCWKFRERQSRGGKPLRVVVGPMRGKILRGACLHTTAGHRPTVMHPRLAGHSCLLTVLLYSAPHRLA